MAVAALLLGGGVFYRTQREAMLHQAESDLSTIAGLKVDQIVSWRAERLGDATVLMEDPFSADAAAAFLASSSRTGSAQLLTRLRSLRDHYGYLDIQLVDAEDRLRLSVSGREAPLDPQTLQGLALARETRRPVLVDLHVGPTEPRPSIEAIAPIIPPSDPRSNAVGAFILRSDPEQFLYPLIQTWPTPSATAETLLVRRDADQVLFLNDLRHQPDTALNLRIPMTQTDLPAVMAVEGMEGIVQGVDYRGVRVLAALQAVPDSPWFMVAKIDRADALAVWRSRSALILLMVLGLAGAAVAATGVVWQSSRRAHFQRLFEAETARKAIEARHRATLLSVGEAVVVAGHRGTVEFMNPVAERMTGWTGADAVGRPLAEILTLIEERSRQPVELPVEGVLRGATPEPAGEGLLLIGRDGREVAIAESLSPILGDHGECTGVVVVIRDQTEDRLARRFTDTRLELIEFATNHTLEELLVRAVDCVAAFVESPIGFYHFVEPDQTTLSLQVWSSRTVREFCSAEGRGLHYDIDQAGVWVDCVRTRTPVIHNDYPTLPHRRGLPEGHAEVVRELVAPVIRDDKVVAILGVGNKPVDYTPTDVDVVAYLADVTWQIVEQKRAEETIRRMAYHDSLTGLPNRPLFDDRLQLALSNARRRQDHLALMVLDLDRFKEVNDTRGHHMGDELLQAAAQRLRGLVRETDTVARMGGDEFCLLMPGLSAPANAVTAAEKIVEAFRDLFVLEGDGVLVTASLGIAVFPDDGDDELSLMRHADRAMYQAKREGRNTYRVYVASDDLEGRDPLH